MAGFVVEDGDGGAVDGLAVVAASRAATDVVCDVPEVVLHAAINAVSDTRPVTAAAEARFVIAVA